MVHRDNSVAVAAVDIGGTHLRMMLADGKGQRLAHWSAVLSAAQKSPAAVCRLIQEALYTLCRQADVAFGSLRHLTAGAPGITNAQEGVVLSAPNLQDWTDVPLRDLLERETGLPVLVENDTNLAALGEHFAGAARDAENFVFLALGTGLGAGVFLGGRLHRGARGSAGEIGYFRARGQSRAPLRVSAAGELEDLVGGNGTERRWREALLRHGRQDDPRLSPLRPRAVFDLAHGTGDEGEAALIAREVLRDSASLLGEAIVDLSLLLDPELVVLGGGLGSHPALCTEMTAWLSAHEFACPPLRTSALGPEAQLFGAAALSLQALKSVPAS